MISLVIPTFNEARRLGKSLELLLQFLNSYQEEVEVIIADDGSTDPTVKVAEGFTSKFKQFKILRLPHKGKGAAVRAGFLESTGEIVVFTDADFSTPISEIDKLVGKINDGFDIAVGSRALDRSLIKTHQNFFREGMGKVFNFFVQTVAVPGISDTQCGFKAYRRETCQILFEKQIIHGFAFDVEVLYLARKHGFKVVEVPVLWYNDPDSSVNPVRDSIVTFYELFKIRFTHSKEKVSLADKTIYQFYKKKTFLKFGVVGLSSTFVDFFGYYFWTRVVGLEPLVANPFSVEVAIIWGFCLNNLWTFGERQHSKNLFGKFIVYQFVTFGGLVFSQIQILIYIHILNLPDLLAKFISIPLVAIFNYMIHNRWTFRDVSHGKGRTLPFIFLILGLVLLYLILSRLILS